MLGSVRSGVPVAVPSAVVKGFAPLRSSAIRPTNLRLPAQVNKPASHVTRAAAGTLQAQHEEQNYLAERAEHVNGFFPGALGLDDFVARVEIALFNYYGFTAQNSIAFTNACRDEITKTLRDKIDQVFGEAFAINGLGGVLTCGTVGFGAGIAHAPISLEDGREKYVFFSFPHIAIPHKDKPGVLGRFGRSQPSSACGALLAAQGEFQQGGIANTMQPGVHDALNPEYSILKSRLAARFRKEGTSDFKNLDIVELTKVAERALRDDLELLISKSVDTKKADYAVISGVQIHAWSKNYDDEHPNLEMVWPAKSYVVVKGERIDFDLASIPGLSPRQLLELANATAANAAAAKDGAKN